MAQTDVLIVGAGPTGLVLALWLTKLGVKVRIVDKTAEPGTTSRALAVQARTLELYLQLDLTAAVIENGHQVPAVNLWVKGEAAARLSFETIGSGLTPYPFLKIFPQDQHERLLIERLEALDVAVERRTELIHFTDEENGITARLRGPDGQDNPFHGVYREVVRNERIVFTAILDNLPGHELVTTVTFADEGGKTKLTVRQTTPPGVPGLGQNQGWSETLERLADLIAEETKHGRGK